MSSAEWGYSGIWSCLYCEGTWLSKPEVRSFTLMPVDPPEGDLDIIQTELQCPSCKGGGFKQVIGVSGAAFRCVSCSGVFCEKGVIQSLAPQLFSSTKGESGTGAKLAAGIAFELASSAVFSIFF